MAERTTQSWTTVPHFFVSREVDATALNAARAKQLGLKYISIPFSPQQPDPKAVDTFLAEIAACMDLPLGTVSANVTASFTRLNALAAAYGTFPIASALFASLTKVSEIIGRHAGPLDFLRLNQESLAIYFDVCTFLLSATLIWSLTLPRNRPAAR